ncbi:hypothetical protein, partial [Roseibium sp.]|uniref:hypothetical protein n=1 Tax=Roseibium sp. TaxID=1936156 RepID=UPI00329A2E6C
RMAGARGSRQPFAPANLSWSRIGFSDHGEFTALLLNATLADRLIVAIVQCYKWRIFYQPIQL